MGHSQEVEKTEEEGRKAACGFGEIGENCDFTSSAILNLRMHGFANNYE
jgi:hypothetical protein